VCCIGAAGSESEGRADAGRRRLQALESRKKAKNRSEGEFVS